MYSSLGNWETATLVSRGATKKNQMFSKFLKDPGCHGNFQIKLSLRLLQGRILGDLFPTKRFGLNPTTKNPYSIDTTLMRVKMDHFWAFVSLASAGRTQNVDFFSRRTFFNFPGAKLQLGCLLLPFEGALCFQFLILLNM